MKNMKNLLFPMLKSLMICAVLFGFARCQFDEYDVKYTETSVLFTYQDYIRNIVVGEGLKLNAGIVLAGVQFNKTDRVVQYVIDPTLVTGSKSVLPSNYYKLGHPTEIRVPKDQLKGYLPIEMDSVAFLADPKSLTGEYVLPIRLVSSNDVDAISDKDFVRMSISYFGKQHGFYHYSGSCDLIIANVLYGSSTYSHIHTETNSRRFIETAGPARFRVTADASNRKDPLNVLNASGSTIIGKVSFFMDVAVDGSSVSIASDPESMYQVRAAGDCSYDPETRSFHLKYLWELEDGTESIVKETLTYRNRIRDDQGNGIYITEWR
jgi:hypothetical protein